MLECFQKMQNPAFKINKKACWARVAWWTNIVIANTKLIPAYFLSKHGHVGIAESKKIQYLDIKSFLTHKHKHGSLILS